MYLHYVQCTCDKNKIKQEDINTCSNKAEMIKIYLSD